MNPPSDVDIVFADLQDAFKDLGTARPSPKQVRRAFSRFVDLTQRLTSVMRPEAKAKTGLDWVAADFPGWNDVTALFKDLRNEDQHKTQIRVSVRETSYFEPFGAGGGSFAVSGTWVRTDQLAEAPPNGVRMLHSDPDTGRPTNTPIPSSDTAYRYLLESHDPKLVGRLQAIGTADIHELSRKCLTSLEAYYEFFQVRISRG
jgi:hypothetical protein